MNHTTQRRADGLLEATRTDKRTGKRIHFYGHNRRQLDEKIMAWTSSSCKGRRFADVAAEWCDKHFSDLAANTLRGYRPAYRRVVNYFAQDYIRQIKPQDVKRFIYEFAAEGKAKKTVATQLLITRLICGYAVENGDIETSPCDHIHIPKNLPRGRREPASQEEENIVRQAANLWLFPYLILYTGLRKGEALALTFDDFDLNNHVVNICKSVYHVGNRPKIKRPKTAAGVRKVPLLTPLIVKLPRKWDGYLFSEDRGQTPLSETQYQRLWKRWAQQTGVTATAHQLRHSYATMLFENGIDVKDAQDILGHTTVAMTQDVYTHLRDTRRKKIAQIIDERLSTNS